jgi:MoaA/NifB/PqqE/SkfB family radical SAM enzyme
MCDFGQKNKKSVNYRIMHQYTKDSDIDINLFKKLIFDVRSFRPVISFKLVEPLLNKDLMGLIKISKQNGLRVELTTNGYLLPLLAEKLVESGLDEIQISIDGPPRVHDIIRGNKGSFKKAIEGINLLYHYKKEYNKIFIKINYTISDLNYNNIVETLNYFKKFKGVDIVKLQSLDFITDRMEKVHNKIFGDYCPVTSSSLSGTNPQKVDVNKLYEQIQIIKKTKYPFLVRFIPNISYTREEIKQYFYDELRFLKKHTRCLLPYKSAYVDMNGDVRPHTRCFDIVMGNINKESFKEIWNGKKYREFRAKIRKRAFPACARCCGVLFSKV